jgi:ABC-type branched-subunit amino acid transport system substrate-binding protein
VLVATLVAALLLDACGSQLSGDELVAADALGAGGGGPSAAGATGPAARDATADRSATGAAGASGGEVVAVGATDAGATDPGAPAPIAPAPADGNGGATDVGVDEDSITLGTVTTLTGPVPGLFRGAALGTQACAARVNAAGGLFGRHLDVQVGDDQANENQVRAQTERLLPQALALVGSFTLFDGAMAAPLEEAGVPDIGTALQPERFASPVNWSPQPVPPGWQTGGLAYLQASFPEASQAVGFLGSESAPTQNAGIRAVLESLGMRLVYDATYGATTSDFTAQVFRMKTAGVRFLIVTGDAPTYARVLQSADQQDLDLDVFNPISNAYDGRYLELAGDLAEGTIIYATHVMFAGEDAASVPEVAEFTTWLRRIDPGAVPDVFGLYGWMSCQLFVRAATAVGPNLTRQALRDALGTITSFDGNGLIAPGNPAGKEPPTCYVVLEVRGGQWQRRDTPADGFRCDGTYLRQ